MNARLQEHIVTVGINVEYDPELAEKIKHLAQLILADCIDLCNDNATDYKERRYHAQDFGFKNEMACAEDACNRVRHSITQLYK